MVYNGELIAAGRETDLGHVARWDGSAWQSMGSGPGTDVRDLCQFNGELYAAGSDFKVSRWNGTDWQPMGQPFNALVLTLEVHNGELFAGGSFVTDLTAGPMLRGLARWNGTAWEEAGGGLNGTVRDLLSTPEGLVITGDFTQNADATIDLPNWTILTNGTFAIPTFPSSGATHISAHPEGGFVLNGYPSRWVQDGQVLELPYNLTCMTPYGGDIIVAMFGEPTFLARGIGRWAPGTYLAWLDEGNIGALINASSALFGGHTTGLGISGPGMEAPIGQGVHTIHSLSPWMIGEHDGTLCGSVPSGPQAPRTTAGPVAEVMDSDDYLDRYLRVWKLDRSEINYHIDHWDDPNYEIPHTIATWPGNGDTANGEPGQIAPYADLNGNGIYEPASGEHPLIRGDQAVFHIIHSISNDSFEPVDSMAIDITLMHYAFDDSTNADLYNTVFTNMRVVNRSNRNYTNARFGCFADFDLGYGGDDRSGCDSLVGLFYAYNADAFDDTTTIYGPGYDDHVPAQGVQFLNHTMTAHRTWPREGPFVSFADKMTGSVNGAPFLEPGYPTHFQYPGGDWMDQSDGGDWYAVGSIGPFTFNAGDTLCVDMAFPFAMAASGNHMESLSDLISRAQRLRTWYDEQDLACIETPDITTSIGITAAENDRLKIFPNPASDAISMEINAGMQPRKLTIHDAMGRVVLQDVIAPGNIRHSVQLQGLEPGSYSLRITDANGVRTGAFITARQ